MNYSAQASWNQVLSLEDDYNRAKELLEEQRRMFVDQHVNPLLKMLGQELVNDDPIIEITEHSRSDAVRVTTQWSNGRGDCDEPRDFDVPRSLVFAEDPFLATTQYIAKRDAARADEKIRRAEEEKKSLERKVAMLRAELEQLTGKL